MSQRNHHEREFEAFLAGEESGLARLYRRLPQAEPDARLDAAVLALARAAVEPQRVNALRHAKARPRRPWWLVGLSSAAGLVLAAGVAWQMRNGFGDGPATALRPAGDSREVVPVTPILREEIAAEAPAPPPPAAFPAEPEPPALMQEAPAAAPVAAAKKPAADLQRQRLASRAAAAPEATAAAPAALSEPAPQAEAKLESQQAFAAEADALDRSAAQVADDSRRVPGQSTGALGGAADKDAARPEILSNKATDYNSVERKAALATGSRRDEYGLAAGEAEKSKAQPSAKADLAARSAAAAASPAPARPTAAAPALAAAPAPAAPPAGATANLVQDPALQQRLQANAKLAPEAWVQAIRTLLRAGSRDEALQNLDLLREKHPRYALPPDLAPLHR